VEVVPVVQILLITPLTKEALDPILLFPRFQSLLDMVAVVVLETHNIFLHQVVQFSMVIQLH
jgi:hypothetical protein